MWTTINAFLKTVDNFVWGVPLMVLILCGGILLTVRLGVLQMRRLPLLSPAGGPGRGGLDGPADGGRRPGSAAQASPGDGPAL